MDGIAKVINIQLPYNADIFIKSKFIKAKVVHIEKTDGIYKAELDNEISITFDENGNWMSINSSKKLQQEYKNRNLDVNEIRKIINSYRIIIDHYLEMHIYNKG